MLPLCGTALYMCVNDYSRLKINGGSSSYMYEWCPVMAISVNGREIPYQLQKN